MGKNKKKKKKSVKEAQINIPRQFFKKIGIRPLVGPNEKRNLKMIEREISRRLGKDTLESFRVVFEPECDDTAFNFCHRSLPLVKVWYGDDINHLCRVAKELKDFEMLPNLKILDIGGGPGHLAFWMARIWNPLKVVVADQYSHIGAEWAQSLNEDRIEFIDSLLPDLKGISDEQFDTIIISRVLGNLEVLDLPTCYDEFNYIDYLKSDSGQFKIDFLRSIGHKLNELLTDDGHLIIADSWSDIRKVLIGGSFEKEGLYMNPDKFDPRRVGKEHSIVVFSKTPIVEPIPDLPLGLSAAENLPNQSYEFVGTSAETMRTFFSKGNILKDFEYYDSNDEDIIKFEIIEKVGLMLLYKVTNGGLKRAWIYPSIYYKKVINMLMEVTNEKIIEKGGRVTYRDDFFSLPN